ncbi:MAG TPA: metallophosphoesterase, partial [Bacteroidales bacterium]|nr:metallophosphoesterase [Bacteroidales bacterium]
MKRIIFIAALCLSTLMLAAQTSAVKFAFIADTHIAEGSGNNDDLVQCINDINKLQKELQFVIFAGDITEFGSDEEIFLAKELIDKLEIPYYIVAGNHDSKWSESGCNTFEKVFGYENFEFEAGGIKFLGSNSGPNMRMAPALMPHESLVWLDSIAKVIPREQPVIFVNHYPQDTSMLNYFQVLNALKQTNIQLVMGGHWHRNTVLDYDGIPGVLGRAPAAGRNGHVGYNIVTISNQRISICERKAADNDGKGGKTGKAWYSREMFPEPQFTPDIASGRNNKYALPANFPWMTFDVNNEYPQVKAIWEIQDESDIGCGAVHAGKYVLYANTKGVVKAL